MGSRNLTIIERRAHPRVEANQRVSFLLKDNGGNRRKEGIGKALNISQGGILLETHTPFEWQDILHISINVEDELVTISGKVVYCNTVAPGIFRTGIEFFKVNQKILSFVIGMLKMHLVS